MRIPLFLIKMIFLFLFVFCGSGQLNAQNNSVVFDGTDDYVDAGNDAAFNGATSIRTMECWVKFTSFGAVAREIMSKSVAGQGIEVLLIADAMRFYCMHSSGAYSYIDYPINGYLLVNTWYHFAVTWDGATKESMRFYINGVSIGTRIDGPNINATGITNAGTFRIGNWSEVGGPRMLAGSVDEVRVWNTNRTAQQIKAGMYGTVATNATGLLAYYKANEAAGTTLVNNTGNTLLDGTLINGAARAASPIQFGHNALKFDGVDDYSFSFINPAYDITTGTVEFLINPTSLSATQSLMLGLRDNDIATRYSFHISNTVTGMWNGTTYSTVPYVFTTGQWYHLAYASNGTTTNVYINGVLAGTLPVGFGTATGLPLIMGKTPIGSAETYNGIIDEVRIWNTQRTITEINTYRNTTLTGTEAGLVALFTFDQGVATGNNSGLTVAPDKSPATNNIGLWNFAMSGTASNFVSSSLTSILPVGLLSFEVNRKNDVSVLSWQTGNELNSGSFIIERSITGSGYTAIGSVPAGGNQGTVSNYYFTDLLPVPGKNYYRLKMEDKDGSFTYSKVITVQFSAKRKLTWYTADGKAIEVKLSTPQNMDYRLSDASGRIISKGILQNGSKIFNGLPAGVYVLSVDAGDIPALSFIVR
ncbi:MAG TPA: LamG-like jellyroll fold domain-containing protein [Chitinophagaceae bacterium]|nr:LamG-like jellyroll fold domain-containing protein [Chitinophagaceae bacterium]